MQTEDRRKNILEALNAADVPLSAGAMAERFGVSRQIIVGDIAILRAAGERITATPRGYVAEKTPKGIVRTVACRHTSEQMEDELNAIVDMGCCVLDVIVDHPLYGQLSGALQLSSRYDVSRFVEKCAQTQARSLCELTEGIHLHTLSCPGEQAYERVCGKLRAMGILLETD